MRVLIVGSDKKVFDEDSGVANRIRLYGGLVDELHLIIFSHAEDNLSNKKLAENIFLYPTKSKSKWYYMRDAVRIGKKLPKPDLITSPNPTENGLAAYRLSRFYKSPLQLQVHADVLSDEYRKESFLNSIRTRIAKHLFPKADCIRVVSERIKHSIIAYFGEHKRLPKITVLPIFVDTNKLINAQNGIDLHERYSELEHIVLIVSRLEPEKDIITALKALKLVKEKISKIGMVIAGDGSQKEHLESYVKRNNLEENVFFIGWQDNVASLFKSADTYLLTSRHEGYAITLVEAAALGCPIVTTQVGIADYVFLSEESALVAPVGDEREIAKHLYRIFKNNRLRLLLAAEAERAQTTHVFQTQEEYLDAYKKSWETCEK